MQKTLAATIAQVVVFLIFSALVVFNAVQVNHLEQLVIDAKSEVETLNRTVSRLQYQLESGELAVRGTSGGDAPQVGGEVDPLLESFRRFYTDEEWGALMRPGNLLHLPTYRRRGPEAVEGGTIHRAFISDIPGLNPLTSSAADVDELYGYITEFLGNRDRHDPEQWGAQLAYRVEANQDFTEYHVWLKHGVMWHSPAVDLSDERYAHLRGEHEMVADDFLFFFELVKNPQVEAPFQRNYYENCSALEVVNDHEFIVRWTVSEYTSLAATIGLQPIPRWLYGADESGQPFDPSEIGRQFNNHWYNQRAIGVGPYRFVEWQQGGSIVLERFPGYHFEQPPIERVEFQVINDATARLNNLRAGELDYIPLQPTQYKNEILDGGSPGFTNGEMAYENFQGTTFRYLGWNADGRFFGDRRVRLAMTHAFNRELVVRENMQGLGRVITGPFFVDAEEYDSGIEPWPFDLNRAAELLEEAGWRDDNGDGIREKLIDGQSVNFEFGMVTYGYRPEMVAAMETFRNDLRRIGVVMNVEPVEWAVMVQRMEEKDFDAYTGGWQLGWDTDLYQIWHSSQADVPRGSNRVGFRSPDGDRIIEELRRTFEPAHRVELCHGFHRLVHEEQPYTFWFAPLETGAWRTRVQNVFFSPIRPFDLSMEWSLAAP